MRKSDFQEDREFSYDPPTDDAPMQQSLPSNESSANLSRVQTAVRITTRGFRHRWNTSGTAIRMEFRQSSNRQCLGSK